MVPAAKLPPFPPEKVTVLTAAVLAHRDAYAIEVAVAWSDRESRALCLSDAE